MASKRAQILRLKDLQHNLAGVERWLKEHPEVVQDAVSKAIDEGAFAAVQRVLDKRMEGVFTSAVEVMQTQGLIPRETG